MADCKNCIHIEVCDQASRQRWGLMAGEKECSDFKDSAKYVEVVHGRWISHYAYVDCSECGESADEHYNYCPNCGAIMDLERRSDNGND